MPSVSLQERRTTIVDWDERMKKKEKKKKKQSVEELLGGAK
jgi:hypothetical protein